MDKNAQKTVLKVVKTILSIYSTTEFLAHTARELTGLLGWNLPEEVLEDFADSLTDVRVAVQLIDQLVEIPPKTLPEFRHALDICQDAFRHLADVVQRIQSYLEAKSEELDGGDQDLADQIIEEGILGLFSQLVDLVGLFALITYTPELYHLLSLLTLIEPGHFLPEAVFELDRLRLLRFPHYRAQLQLFRTKRVLTEPGLAFPEVYLQPSAEGAPPEINTEKLLPRLAGFLESLSQLFNQTGQLIDFIPDKAQQKLGIEAIPEFLDNTAKLVDVTVVQGTIPGNGFNPTPREIEMASRMLTFWFEDEADIQDRFGATIAFPPAIERPAKWRDRTPIVVLPFGQATLSKTTSEWQIDVAGSTDIGSIWIAGDEVEFESPNGSLFTQINLKRLSSTDEQADLQNVILWGSTEGSRLALQGLRIALEADLGTGSDNEFGVAIAVEGASLVIAPGDGDGFLETILPSRGLRADFDLSLAWTNRRGLFFGGSTDLAYTYIVGTSNPPGGLPAAREQNGISLDSYQLSLLLAEEGIKFTTTATARVQISAVTTVIDRVGLKATLDFPPNQVGNLGFANLDIDFQAPAGLALSIDSGPVSGGGYLFFDSEKEQYAGIVQLEFEELSLIATGLLTTRMPDGSSGFSLLIMLAVDDFQPIELGLGFKLTGVGGLLGFNRTVAVDVLQKGLKNKTLDRVLFPADPIKNAAAIVSTLRSVFPPTPDQYVLGPIAQISWGKEGLLTANLGIVLEFPNPVRLALLGQIKATFPTKEAPLVRLNLDLLGVIDFEKGEAFVLATLFDSKFYRWDVSGDAAFFLRWKRNPTFILSVGGFHPAYLAPPEVPTLARLSMMLSQGKNLQLRMTWYMALTSNTLQHGSRVDLEIKASKFRIKGHLSYDALFQFEPFSFTVLFSAGVALKWGSRTLASVQLEGSLAGPTPWHIKGKAKFKIWRFSKSVSFDRTIGATENLPPLPVVNPQPALISALADTQNWKATLPAAHNMFVTLKEEHLAPDIVKLHPLGELAVRQQVVPLKTTIEKFGNSRTALAASYQIQTIRLRRDPDNPNAFEDLNTEDIADTQEFFAPDQFQTLSQSEKLAQRSFIAMDAGVRTQGGRSVTYDGDHLRTVELDYDQDLRFKPDTTSDPVTERQIESASLPVDELTAQAMLGASAKLHRHQPGVNRFANPARRPVPLDDTDVDYVIANRNDLGLYTDSLSDGDSSRPSQPFTGSYHQALEVLREYERKHPLQASQLQIVPKVEVLEVHS